MPKKTEIHFESLAPLLSAILMFKPASKKSFNVMAASEFKADATVL